MTIHCALAVVVAIQTSPASPASAPAANPLQTRAEAAREAADAPALGLVVIRADGAPEIAVSGRRLVGDETAVTTDDRWHWGSITKSMTATLVARLVEKGVVDWDDTIGGVLGDAAPDMLDDYRPVTLLHLLTHRSGLPANIPIERFGEFAATPDDPVADRLAWVRIALAQPPRGPVEATYEYSNNGYIVAGAMLEAKTGRPWEELIRREVFEPLELTSAGFGAPAAATPVGQPRGHRPSDGADIPAPPDADNPPALGPAGRVHMSLADMARYLQTHATRRDDFLGAASYERLRTPPFGGVYALGWVAISPESRWHNGSNTMWYAEAAFNLTDGTSAAVVVNDGDIAAVQPTIRALLVELLQRDG